MTTGKGYTCELCNYSFRRRFNLERHLYSKHMDVYMNDLKEEAKQSDPNTCSKCSKVFSTEVWMRHHEAICKGVNEHTCEFCKKEFSAPCNKYRHLKTCKRKKESDQAMMVKNATYITNNNTIQTQNNIETQNNQTIQTQNNVNIIVFKPEDMQFLTDHIDMKKITKLIAQDTRRPEDRQEPRSIISTYGRELLERPENKCIQKKNLRANYAKVHLGKNKWKSMLDQDVYPKLACDIANTFQNFLFSCTNDVKTNIRLYVRERMIPFLDYMAEQGYCNDEERAQNVMEQFNALVQELRLVTFDLTNEAKVGVGDGGG